MEIIPPEQRKNKRCYFCNTNLSVKYIVKIFDPVINDNRPSWVYCCNKCALCFDRKEVM